jgi:hypothetical protein
MVDLIAVKDGAAGVNDLEPEQAVVDLDLYQVVLAFVGGRTQPPLTSCSGAPAPPVTTYATPPDFPEGTQALSRMGQVRS